MPPRFRRKRTRLSPDQVAQLVAMRDGGANWKDIGRAFGKQEGDCKVIYDHAESATVSGVGPTDFRGQSAAQPQHD